MRAMLRVTPLQKRRLEKERQVSVPRFRLRDEPFTAPDADKTSQGPPRIYLVSRKYERLKEEEEDKPDSDNVIDFLSRKRDRSGKDE
ncbi:hypothetical protein A8232_005112 [Salmonella enterica subsp. enterica serovar Kokomlemle]|nr:hypothetical protein [Salmonella enterica subsp. enterica serovar Kokomlemle]